MTGSQAVKSVRRSTGRKVAQIIGAARKLFLEHGYGETSMDAVVVESGVSKATVYAYFPTKKDLFAAVVDDFLVRYSSAELDKNLGHKDIRLTLLKLGRSVVSLLTAPDAVAAHRMVTAEAARSPKLGRLFYESGPAHLLSLVERVISDAMKRGQLRSASSGVAADQFISLVKSDLRLRALMCAGELVSEKQKKAAVRTGVDTFYRAFKPEAARRN